MRVLIVTTGYPRNTSDLSGIFIKRLAVAMARFGAKITVLAPGDKDAKLREQDGIIDVVRFSYAIRPFMKIAYGDGGVLENIRRWPWLIILMPFFIFFLILNVLKLSQHCDVIHANWLATGFFALSAKRIRKKPLIVTLRGSDKKMGASVLFPFLIKRADAITTVNHKWAKNLVKEFGHKVFYIPNGVEATDRSIDPKTKYGIHSSEIIVLYVGVLRKVKGADILSEVARIMIGSDTLIRFLVVGPGDPKEFGLAGLSNVICTGGLPPADVLAIYSSCDIFLLPSRHEGRPNALLEAMASGLPSVATRVSGVIEVLNIESGILVDRENPSALASAIEMLANDPQKRKNMGEKARSRILELNLNWESSAKKYLELFQMTENVWNSRHNRSSR